MRAREALVVIGAVVGTAALVEDQCWRWDNIFDCWKRSQKFVVNLHSDFALFVVHFDQQMCALHGLVEIIFFRTVTGMPCNICPDFDRMQHGIYLNYIKIQLQNLYCRLINQLFTVCLSSLFTHTHTHT